MLANGYIRLDPDTASARQDEKEEKEEKEHEKKRQNEKQPDQQQLVSNVNSIGYIIDISVYVCMPDSRISKYVHIGVERKPPSS